MVIKIDKVLTCFYGFIVVLHLYLPPLYFNRMHKKILFAIMCLFSVQAQAQENSSTASKPSRDYVMLQFGYDTWLNAPDSIKMNGFNRSYGAYLCYDFPIKNSNFSFAAGIGVGGSNLYFNKQKAVLNDTSIAEIQFISDTILKKSKLSLNYLEAPFELRYFSNKENRNKGVKAAVGLRVGTILQQHSKIKNVYSNKPIIEKVQSKRFVETWRVAATARVGYGNFSVYGAYYLNNLFKSGSGPQNLSPISVGICLSGL